MIRTLLLALTLLVAACGVKAPQSPAQAVFAAEASYTAAVNVATAYASLPRCVPEAGPALCSEPAIVQRVKAAAHDAWTALRAAQAAVRKEQPDAGEIAATQSLADKALAAFRAITARLKVH